MYKDIKGKKFGRLVAVKNIKYTKQTGSIWLTKCDCGKTKEVPLRQLGSRTNSCGCLKKELLINRFITHGLSKKDPIYQRWKGMRNRCNNKNNPSYKNYGARGIKVCEQWTNFAQFLKDMGYPNKGETLERINNDKDYCKENCIWANKSTQSWNKSNTKRFIYLGKEITFREMSLMTGLSIRTLAQRINKLNWTLEKTIHTPLKVKK